MDEETIDKVTTIVSNIISLFIILSMFSDLIGIPLSEILYKVVTAPWVIPVDIIEKYWFVWVGMQWILFILILVDWVYSQIYLSRRKERPPPSYNLYLSAMVLVVSFFLAVILRAALFIVLTVFSVASLLNAFFRLK